VTIEGVPAGLALGSAEIGIDLARRQRGYGRGARQSIEHDAADIVSGVRHGVTLGSPILLLVANRDWENWTGVMQVEGLTDSEAAELAAAADGGNKRATPVTRVRPGHADLAGALKYGFNDVRNVLERASARETAARVAAGGVARAILRELGVEVWSFTAEVGGVAVDPARASRSREAADASPLRCPDPDAETAMIARIDEARAHGDTVGGVFEVVAHGLPIGLGSYVQWDRRLDAALAAAVMSINIVKGVEFGLGFEQTKRFGSAVHDVIAGRGEGGRWIHRSNNAGGLTGGITNGEPLVVRGAVKPISTLARPLPSADLISGEAVDKAHYERSDISVVPAAGVVAEAMVMLTLADAMLDKFGGDTIADTRDALERYVARISDPIVAPIAGGRRDGATATAPSGGRARAGAATPGGDEAGSGGDD
jgi:chorismate synthase